MYISTLASHLQLNSSIRSLQSQLMDAQKEISTGRKADLVAALRDRAAEDVDLRNALNDVTEFKSTTDIVASRMDTMQAALGGVHDIAEQMRNTALTSRDAVSRRYLQEAASTALDRINSFLNAQVAGRNLFSGIQTDTAPMQAQTSVNAATAAAGGQPGHRQCRPDHRRGVGACRGQRPGRRRLDLQRHQQQPEPELLSHVL
jgi:flagellar hook-associated protein 3 FlgL